MSKLTRWWHRRQVEKAIRILRKTYERHLAADHNVVFHADDHSCVIMQCSFCPDLEA